MGILQDGVGILNKKLALFGFLLLSPLAKATSAPQATNDSGRATFQAIYPGNSKTIATSASSAQSTAFASSTVIVQVFCTQDAYLAFGTNPVATSSSMFLPGGIQAFYGVATGGSKMAALQVTASGTCYLTEGQ